MLGRRGFLGSLVGALAAVQTGLSLDPEKLLWVPGQKLISIPSTPVTPVMLVDDLGVIDSAWIAKESARLVERALTGHVRMECVKDGSGLFGKPYNSEDTGKIGWFRHQFGVDFNTTSVEKAAMDRIEYSRLVLAPRAEILACNIKERFESVVFGELQLPRTTSSIDTLSAGRATNERISVRVVSGYDLIMDRTISRMEVLMDGVERAV